jgi:diguanylate cyclase (GGDEF)-like protein
MQAGLFSPPISRFRRLLHFHQWQQVALLLAVGLQAFSGAPLQWFQWLGFAAVCGASYWGLALMGKALNGFYLQGAGPAMGWHQLFTLQVLGSWGCLAVALVCVGLPVSSFGLLALASVPAFLLGLRWVGQTFFISLTLAGGCLAFYYSQPVALANLGQVNPVFTTLQALVPALVLLWPLGKLTLSLHQLHEHQVEQLQAIATTDGLTHLINRRHFNSRLAAELSGARRHKKALSLGLFDIDNFKHINDYYGHLVGDRILQELGQLLIENTRESDVAARYGGEEFALILPETRRLEAYELLERLRNLIEQHVFCMPDLPISITVSVGVTQFDSSGHNSSNDFVEESDKALYEAKGLGKNRVVIYGMGGTRPSLLNVLPGS